MAKDNLCTFPFSFVSVIAGKFKRLIILYGLTKILKSNGWVYQKGRRSTVVSHWVCGESSSLNVATRISPSLCKKENHWVVWILTYKILLQTLRYYGYTHIHIHTDNEMKYNITCVVRWMWVDAGTWNSQGTAQPVSSIWCLCSAGMEIDRLIGRWIDK